MACSLAAVVMMAFTWVGKEMHPAHPVAMPKYEQSSDLVESMGGGELGTVAVYNSQKKLLVVRDSWDCDRLHDRALVVHEMVHHYQRSLGLCLGEACEPLAYALQEKFIDQND